SQKPSSPILPTEMTQDGLEAECPQVSGRWSRPGYPTLLRRSRRRSGFGRHRNERCRVAREMHGQKWLVGAAVKDPAGAVVSIGDEQFVDFTDEEDSLGFL